SIAPAAACSISALRPPVIMLASRRRKSTVSCVSSVGKERIVAGIVIVYRLVSVPCYGRRVSFERQNGDPFAGGGEHFPPRHDRPKCRSATVFHAVLRGCDAAGRTRTGAA